MASNSRSKNAFLNIIIGYISQIGILLLTFVGRMVFLRYLSIDYLGINGLYSNILTVLSLAQLGLDSALLFSLYEPVAKNDTSLICSLLHFFKRIYTILAIVVFFIGVALIPVLRYIVNSDLSQTDLIIYYLLFLINTVVSYFAAHKIALLSAFQEQRFQRLVFLLSNLILQVIYIIVLVLFKNYFIYLLATVITTIVSNVLLGYICDYLHPEIIPKQIIEFDKKPIINRMSATLMYKVGAVAINNTDNILISMLVNTVAVGLYSNYFAVVSAIQGFIAVITVSLISGVGNLSTTGNKKRMYELFNFMVFFYHLIAAIGGVGFALLFNDLITIWLGSQFLFDQLTVLAIALNFYLITAVTPIWMYREANGIFGQVKYLMWIRALLNIILSIVFGLFCGTMGILLATAISLMISSFWYEPRILYREVFQKSSSEYWLKQGKYCLITCISAILSYYFINNIGEGIILLFVKAIIIVIVVTFLFLIFNFNSQELKEIKTIILHRR